MVIIKDRYTSMGQRTTCSLLLYIVGELVELISEEDPHPAAGRRHLLRAILDLKEFTSIEYPILAGLLNACHSIESTA